MWKPPILLCSTASRPSARSSPYSGKNARLAGALRIALLTALALTPDVLALPWQPPAWSAVQVDEQWLIRHQPWGGMAAENVWLTELLQSEAEEHVIDSYSPPPAAPGVWRSSLRRHC